MLGNELEARDREEMDGKTELIEYLFSELETSERIGESATRFADVVVGHPHLQIGVRDEATWLVPPASGLRSALEGGRATAVPVAPRVLAVPFADGYWWLRRIEFGTNDNRVFTAYVALHVDPAQLLVSRLRNWLMVTGLMGVAASGLLGWLVAKRGLAPLKTIGSEAERVTAQHLGPFLRAEDAPGEIRALVEAINRMLDRLGASFRALEEFSADIAHELRTPLHNLMLQTQVTLSRPRSADDYQDALHNNLEELEHLQRMVSDMLFLARADRGMFQLASASVDMRHEADEVAEFFEIAAMETGKAINVTGSGTAACDRAMARRALTNLVSNAVRYSPPASRIDIRIEEASHGECQVTVSNPAAPMSTEELRRLCGRFARGQHGDQDGDEGSGLGLSIVASIMRLHGSEVAAEWSDGKVYVQIGFPNAPAGGVEEARTGAQTARGA